MKKIVLYQTDILKLPILAQKEFHTLYHYNGKIIKIIRGDIPDQKKQILQQLEKVKIHQVDSINFHNNHLIPKAVVLDEHGYCGYCMEKEENQLFNSSNLEEICTYYKNVEHTMEYGHQQGIIFPDLFSQGNIIYNQQLKQPKFIDFDGWQIKQIPAGTRSNLKLYRNQICQNPKFKQKNLYQVNFDRLMLLRQFLIHLTNIDILEHDIPSALQNIINFLSIQDNPLLIQELQTIFNLESTTPIPVLKPLIEEIEHHLKTKKKH